MLYQRLPGKMTAAGLERSEAARDNRHFGCFPGESRGPSLRGTSGV
jgi:hypothetical protein